jgi:hypothetical protein
LRALGPMCCAPTPAYNRRWGGTQAVDLALSLELAYSNGPCPQVRRAITVVVSVSALGTLAAVEGKRVGNCQSQQDKYACCKAILGVSLLSDPTEHPLWSFQFPRWDVACRKCAKVKNTAGHVLQGAASVGSFILFKQANARFAKPLQLPGWVDEICDPVEAEASGLRLLKHCQGYLCFVSQ